MKTPPTLIDHLYRASFSNKPMMSWNNNERVRDVLKRARRFVLDEGMATMLGGELATAAFTRERGESLEDRERNYEKNVRVHSRKVEQLRIQSRLPFPITWFEYPLHPAMRASNAMLGREFNPHDVPQTEGWLLEQHPGIPTAAMLSIFSRNETIDAGDGNDVWTFPISFAWVTDDAVVPWRAPFELPGGSTSMSEIATGIMGYKSDRIGIASNPLFRSMDLTHTMVTLLREWTGVMRRVFALLSTLNDLPLAFRDVVASKGFIGRGSYKKYLDHRTLTLTIPASEYRKVARKVIAAARRKAHEVRGHWRIDWRHPPDPMCPHDYVATDDAHLTCRLCRGMKIHIPPHERGDASLGMVTHDYRVTTERERTDGSA